MTRRLPPPPTPGPDALVLFAIRSGLNLPVATTSIHATEFYMKVLFAIKGPRRRATQDAGTSRVRQERVISFAAARWVSSSSTYGRPTAISGCKAAWVVDPFGLYSFYLADKYGGASGIGIGIGSIYRVFPFPFDGTAASAYQVTSAEMQVQSCSVCQSCVQSCIKSNVLVSAS